MTRPVVAWAATVVCVLAVVVAAGMVTVRRPCAGGGPRGGGVMLVLVGAVLGTAAGPVVTALGGPGWVDVAATAAVVGPLLVYGVVSGVAWLRDRRQWRTVYVRADRDRAGVR